MNDLPHAAEPSAWPTRLAVGFLACGLVAVHLIVDEGCYDVAQMPRLLALLAALAVGVTATLVPAVSARLDASILRGPVVLAAAALLAITAASLAQAVNVSAGFTDLFRTLASFLVLCLGCLLLPAAPRWRERLLRMAVVGAAVAAGLGLSQTAAQVGVAFPSRRDMEAVTGLMSNVNLYASFLLLLLPWCGCAAVLLPGGWRIVAATVTLEVLGMLLLLQSRAAWLGLAAAGIVAAAAVLARWRFLGVAPAVRRGILGGLVAAAACGVGAVALTGGDTAVGRGLERLFVSRPHQAAGPSDGGRTMIWKVTARMIADHPLAGVGAGNFTVRLHEYYGGDDLDFTNLSSDNWVEPHNDFLWVAAEKGLPGLAVFVALLAAGACSAVRALRAAASRADAWLALATLAGLTAYVVFSCFDFPLDRVSHQVLLALLLAVAAVLSHAVPPQPARRPLPPAWLVGPPVLACLVLGMAYARAAIRQEQEALAARRGYRDGDWEAMRAAARRAATPWKTLDPFATPIAYLEGKAELQLGRLPEAVACLERAWEANPNRLYVLNDLGIAYAASGRFEEAIACFRIAANRYPDRLEPRNNLANCFLDTGEVGAAIAVLEDVPEPLRTDTMRETLARARAALAAAAPEAGGPSATPAPGGGD